MGLKIGADPELFCMKNGIYISAHMLLPGTKHEPFFVENGAVQVDGVAAEFNIDAAETEDEFVGNIHSVIHQMEEIIKSNDPEVSLVYTPTATFDADYFFGLPDDVLALGCEPDFCAYSGKANEKPETKEPFRTGSGHIHIGWTSGEDTTPGSAHFEACREVVRALDENLYGLSLSWDSDDKRRSLYGKMGSFRPKNYGVEYRPLSNRFLVDDEIIKTVYRVTVELRRIFA